MQSNTTIILEGPPPSYHSPMPSPLPSPIGSDHEGDTGDKSDTDDVLPELPLFDPPLMLSNGPYYWVVVQGYLPRVWDPIQAE